MKHLLAFLLTISAITMAHSQIELVTNGDFEDPAVAFDIVSDASVPGWTTATGLLELWPDGFGGVPAYSGSQFVEMLDVGPNVYTQDLTIPANANEFLEWSFAHRGRSTSETIEVFMGPIGNLQSVGIFTSPTGSWSEYSGVYQVPPGETTIRLEIATVFPATSVGNLFDDMSVIASVTTIPTMGQWAVFLFGLISLTLAVVGVYNISVSTVRA